MSKVIDLPSDLTDSLKIADLLELTCLINEDNNVSKSDLEQELRRSSVFDSPDNIQDEEIEKYCLKIFQELEFRAKAAGKARRLFHLPAEHPDWIFLCGKDNCAGHAY